MYDELSDLVGTISYDLFCSAFFSYSNFLYSAWSLKFFRQQGHFGFVSSHFLMHSLWNVCLQYSSVNYLWRCSFESIFKSNSSFLSTISYSSLEALISGLHSGLEWSRLSQKLQKQMMHWSSSWSFSSEISKALKVLFLLKYHSKSALGWDDFGLRENNYYCLALLWAIIWACNSLILFLFFVVLFFKG